MPAHQCRLDAFPQAQYIHTDSRYILIGVCAAVTGTECFQQLCQDATAHPVAFRLLMLSLFGRLMLAGGGIAAT